MCLLTRERATFPTAHCIWIDTVMTCCSSTGGKLMGIEGLDSVLDSRFIHFDDLINGKLRCGEYLDGDGDGPKR